MMSVILSFRNSGVVELMIQRWGSLKRSLRDLSHGKRLFFKILQKPYIYCY
jgi:hypothetical protein